MSGTATKDNFAAEVTEYQETRVTTSHIWIWFSKDKKNKQLTDRNLNMLHFDERDPTLFPQKKVPIPRSSFSQYSFMRTLTHDVTTQWAKVEKFERQFFTINWSFWGHN